MYLILAMGEMSLFNDSELKCFNLSFFDGILDFYKSEVIRDSLVSIHTDSWNLFSTGILIQTWHYLHVLICFALECVSAGFVKGQCK